jgi:hypothetical protein
VQAGVMDTKRVRHFTISLLVTVGSFAGTVPPTSYSVVSCILYWFSRFLPHPDGECTHAHRTTACIRVLPVVSRNRGIQTKSRQKKGCPSSSGTMARVLSALSPSRHVVIGFLFAHPLTYTSSRRSPFSSHGTLDLIAHRVLTAWRTPSLDARHGLADPDPAPEAGSCRCSTRPSSSAMRRLRETMAMGRLPSPTERDSGCECGTAAIRMSDEAPSSCRFVLPSSRCPIIAM